MLVFDTARPARFSARVDFSREGFANLSFFAGDGLTIPYHLSLRHDAGLAVSNRRGADAGSWGEEIRHPLICGTAARLDLRFAAPRLDVWLDETRLFSFGRGWLRPGWPGLETIRRVEMTGGIVPASCDLDLSGGGDALVLDARLELRAALAPEDVTLQAGDADLPVIRDRAAGRMRAPLPGRVWRDIPDGTALSVQLKHAGRILSDLRIDRAEIAARVSTLLERHGLDRDPALLARVVEQVRFAGCLDMLTPGAQARLSDLANAAGLGAFLQDGATAPRSVPRTGIPPKPDGLHSALAQVARALRQTGAEPSDWPRLLTPPAGQEAAFFLNLSDPFCQREEIDLLWPAAQAHGLGAVRSGESLWQDSTALPFLLLAGRTEDIAPILQRMARDRETWVATAPAAWTVKRMLQEETPERLRVIHAFLRFVTAQARDPWGRSPCLALIGAGVALLTALPDLPLSDRDRIERRLLHAWGLSRDFWALVAQASPALSARTTAAQAGFATLSDPQADHIQKADALTLFDALGCPEARRVRHDSLGPSGLGPPHIPPTAEALEAAGLPLGQALLRHMACPGAAAPADELFPLLRAALPEACQTYIPVTRSPAAAQEEAATRQVQAMLQAEDPDAGLEQLLLTLRELNTPHTGWSGLGLALALARGLHGRGKTAPALDTALEDLAEQALTGASPSDLAGLPACAAPLATLPAQSEALARLATAAPPAPALGEPAGAANPLFDTLVVVFSCRAHLESRIPALRAAWLNDLDRLGVPHVILTGDGDGRLVGDHLQLDVPDDYAGLPQKTLAALRWCVENTSYAHLLKVDDDCFLNVDAFFHAFSHRKADYYGRILSRLPGDLDRGWHCAKATSLRGRFELDTSPEPSVYCDGGSGYALSRRAMTAALHAAETPAGQALIAGSFMEDKLLGDLLSLEGISPQNEGYDVTLRRRATANGLPVPRWLNGFDASAVAPVKLVHLDDPAAQNAAAQTLPQPVLTPKKLWPSSQPAWLGENSNALELISPLARLEAAREAPVTVIAALRNEMPILPHFLAHYRAMGVESFAVADNGSDDGTLEYLADQPDVALFAVDTDYNRSQYGVAWQQALMSNLRPGRWSLVADADEFLVWQAQPEGASLPALLDNPAFETADAARIFMLDLYPEGPLDRADLTKSAPFDVARFTDRTPLLETALGRGPFSNAPTWTSAVRHRLFPGSRPELFVAQKIALLKYAPWHRLSAGLHYVAGARLANRELFFGHFKYDARFHAKARAEVARGQHFNAAEEYRAYLRLLEEGQHRIFDPAVSAPWQDTDFVRARLW